MKIATVSYSNNSGWTKPLPDELDSPNTVVIVFGAKELGMDAAPFEELERAFPCSVALGCSTAGEILGPEISDGTLSVAIACFEHTEVRVASAQVATAEASRDAGASIARSLSAPDLRGILVFSDGIHVNGSQLLQGINSVVGKDVVVSGGLAGDGSRFEHTWVLRHGRPVEGYVSAVGLYGERLVIGHGSRGGWDKFGPERTVTRSAGNVLYELDGKPALELYKTYLGERASGLPATALLFPLSLRNGEEDPLVRTILSIDEAAQSLTFAGDIPEGARVQLMRANFDRLIEGAAQAADLTRARSGGAENSLTIAISCVGRRLVLGDRAEEEVEAVAHGLPADAHLVGFYSYGEISPYASGRCDLHNQTMTLSTLCEV